MSYKQTENNTVCCILVYLNYYDEVGIQNSEEICFVPITNLVHNSSIL